jgi:hypothetical protein
MQTPFNTIQVVLELPCQALQQGNISISFSELQILCLLIRTLLDHLENLNLTYPSLSYFGMSLSGLAYVNLTYSIMSYHTLL